MTEINSLTSEEVKAPKKKKKNFLFRIISFLIKSVLLIVLPFIILIRGSVFLNVDYNLHVWASVFSSLFITSIILLIYFIVLFKLVFKKKITWNGVKTKMFLVILILGSYCGYTMLYISSQNAKSTEVEGEYLSIHPLLRMSVSTILFLDNDLLITDLSRTHEDYDKMGLKALKNSLHYKQPDGYVHAMDLRTIGRSELRNTLLKLYFDLMGFNTLRHDGTADHLHISLPLHGKPNVI